MSNVNAAWAYLAEADGRVDADLWMAVSELATAVDGILHGDRRAPVNPHRMVGVGADGDVLAEQVHLSRTRQLWQAARLLAEARARGNMPDFWKWIGRIEGLVETDRAQAVDE